MLDYYSYKNSRSRQIRASVKVEDNARSDDRNKLVLVTYTHQVKKPNGTVVTNSGEKLVAVGVLQDNFNYKLNSNYSSNSTGNGSGSGFWSY